MYYYLLGHHHCSGRLSEFLIFKEQRYALDEAMRLERGNRSQQVSCEQFVIIPTRDLWTLVRCNHAFFRNEIARNIAECYFCRTYLPLRRFSEGRHEDEEVQRLLEDALEHGHCLWCHRPYRRTGNHPRLDEVEHLKYCQVLSELGEVDTQ